MNQSGGNKMRADTIQKYAAPVPRYTSYPTAPHFSTRVSELQYVDWLTQLPARANLSLYAHIPYCHQLCWYCGCNTKATQKYAPVAHYLHYLRQEIGNVSALVPNDHSVKHMHWGGGSPNILAATDIASLAQEFRSHFNFAPELEFGVEIDPRHLTVEQVASFCSVGINRISVGVQDFDAAVQAAIGRQQSFEETQRAINAFRERGVASVNVDLMYGLPLQTRASTERTVEKVVALKPDRIATFGYAHLPARMPNQRLINSSALPDCVERYGQASRIARRLTAHGYVRIGLDHFAKPPDALACKAVSRNFQGYTTDAADALLGVGASAIGRLQNGYVQNAATAGDYMRRIKEYGLATARGYELTEVDRARAYAIEALMCRLQFSENELRSQFGPAAEALCQDARALMDSDEDGLLEWTADGFRVTERGRPFIRSVCACLDTHLEMGNARHSSGV
jgi:oxygen-independent coproporphyrinogen-3 oxidase